MDQNAPPYWITIVLATAAWLFTTTVDQILKTPYLVYEVISTKTSKIDDITTTTISLTNITDDKAYPNVSLRFLIESPGEFKTAAVRPYQPAWEGDVEPKPTGHTFEHTLPIIQPGGRFDLILQHTCSNCAMHLTLLSKSADHTNNGQGDSVIVLTERNYITMIAEHHVAISGAAVILLFLVLLIYLFNQTVRLTHPTGRAAQLLKESKQ